MTTTAASVPLAFVDTETTGVHAGRVPWEIAVIRREVDGTQTEWQAFIEVDLSKADRFGLNVGRFYERHPLGCWLSGRHGDWDEELWGRGVLDTGNFISTLDAAFRFARLTHGAHVIGAVPNFDTETMDPLVRSHEIITAHHYHLIDVETLAVGFLAARGKPIAPPWKSDDLFVAFDVKVADEDRHTALGDARAAMQLYDAVMSGSLA